MVAGVARHRHSRQRARRQAQTSGAFWALATVGDEGVARGVGPQEVFALVRVTWALEHPDYNARNCFDVGKLVYAVDRCLPLQTPVALLGDFGVSCAYALQAVILCETSLIRMEDGTNKAFGEFLAAENVFCQCLINCSQAEATQAKSLSTLRSMRVYSRGRYPCILGAQPSNADLRLWRAHVGDM